MTSGEIPRTHYWLYVATVALTAACGLVVEIVAGRMLAPYLGMSLYTWTAIIAVVLAGFSLGHWIGGVIADHPTLDPHRAIAWTLLFAALSTAASLVFLRLFSTFVGTLGLPPVPTIILLTSLLFFLPSLFVGIPSPILAKLAIRGDVQGAGRILGAMYAAGAVGSIAGTLAAGYLFISWLGSIGTILLVTTLYATLCAIYFIWRLQASNALPIVPLAVVTAAAIAIGLGGARVFAFTPHCQSETDYYCIRIVDITREAGEPARVMILDHLAHGMNVARDPDRLLSSYLDLTDQLTKAHTKGRANLKAFFVGGGALTLPRAWTLRKQPIACTVTELDPKVTELAQNLMWVPASPRLKVIHKDARHTLLTDRQNRYDIIIGDAFHDISVPSHLVTDEFFKLVKSRLSENGIYIMNAVDHVSAPRLTLSLVKTLSRTFKTVEIWVDDEQARAGGRITFILLASSLTTPADKLRSPGIPNRTWSRWPRAYVAQLSNRFAPLILRDDFAPVDRLLAGH